MVSVAIVNTGVIPSPPLYGGGVEQHTYAMANALAELGNVIHYITDITPHAVFSKNVIIHEIGFSRGNFHAGFFNSALEQYLAGYKTWRVVETVLRKNHIDVIHFHQRISAELYLIRNRDGSIPTVYTAHNPTPSMLGFSILQKTLLAASFKVVEMKVFEKSTAVITVSKNLKLHLTKDYGVDQNKIFYVPNGIDPIDFPSKNSRLQTLKKYGLTQPFFLFVGKLVERKGVQFLIQAMDKTKSSLVIVGDGELRKKLVAMAKNSRSANRIFFTGSVSYAELINLYRSASVFVLPALAEGLPIAVLEAMASGLPIIATQGIAEGLVVDGYNGFTFPPGNTKILGEKMALFQDSPHLQEMMGANSTKIVENEFTWSKIAKKVASIYNLIIRN